MSAVQFWINDGVKLLDLERFDSAAVVRFINDALNRRPVDPTGAGHAAVLLSALIQGVRNGEDIDPAFRRLLRVRKTRNNKFDPGSANINSTAFNIVLQLERGKISMSEAIGAFHERVLDVDVGADEKSIRTWINAIRPRARRIVELFTTWEKK